MTDLARRVDLTHLLHTIKATPLTALPLAAGNWAAVWWGYTFYYAAQLARTPVALRPLVPDSPNAVFLFGLVLLLYRFGVRHRTLDLFAWALNIKVGIWTTFVLLYYVEGFFAGREVVQSLLLVLHVGMVGQAFCLHRDLRRDRPGWITFGALATFLLFTDVLDYFLPIQLCRVAGQGLHPCLPGPSLPVVGTVTILLSLAILAVAYVLYAPAKAATPAHPNAREPGSRSGAR